MKRRDFIIKGSILGISVATFTYQSCRSKSSESKEKQQSNKPAFEVRETTLDDVQKKMREGAITSKELTQIYLERIKEIDRQGPELRSVIEVNPDALAIAEGLDKERKEGKVRGPLHGIPVLIKDNIDTADKMATTAGSLALSDNHASNDAYIVNQLREAGAVLLGKTNLSEWANFRSTRSSSGWSSRGGQTKNPYVITRNPCGSSSGSGVAVSANLCAVSIGTETDGSIICPAAVNGVVGIKPTVGLWSRSGIIPISETQDTPGPMARTVRDATIFLGLLTALDPNDTAMSNQKRNALKDYTSFLKADGLKGKRIGVEKSLLKGHEGIDKIIADALDVMKQHGAEIVEVDVFTKIGKLGENELKVLEYEFKDGLDKYLSKSNSKMKSLKDVIEFNKQNEGKVMPYFKQEIMDSSEVKKRLDSKYYYIDPVKINLLNKSKLLM